MSRVKEFRLPDLGEGLTEGEILQWMVAPGDTITLNQPIVEVETAKAAVEVPSPFAGVVVSLHHPAGTVVDVGAVIISVDTEPDAGPLDLVPSVEGALIGEVGANGRTANLVGYGPKSGTAVRRARTAPQTAAPPPPARVSAAVVAAAAAEVTVLAKPPVRKLARELGVDLQAVHGTGPGGTITRQDVEGAVPRRYRDYASEEVPVAAEGWFAYAPLAAQQYEPATRERRTAVRGVRKVMAEAMVASAFTAPHVTVFLTLDVTPTMELVRRLRELPEFAGVKVSPLLLVAKAVLLAVKRHPLINSTFTDEAIVEKEYVHLGIAAATPRGLMVPNLKDADRMSLVQLAGALQDLVATAREGKTSPADMAGGTLTITNVGVFGIDTGTPILNAGESAILAFGAVRPTPWVVDGAVVVRDVTTLALSFDHRHIDGQLGSQFLADVGRVLADPAVALAWS